MNQPFDLRLNTLGMLFMLSIINSGCGGVVDPVTTTQDVASFAIDPTKLVIEETAKRRKEQTGAAIESSTRATAPTSERKVIGSGTTGSAYIGSGTTGSTSIGSGTTGSTSIGSGTTGSASSCDLPTPSANPVPGNSGAPRVIDDGAIPAGKINTPFSYQLMATGEGPIKFSIVDGALPAGLSLDEITGVISGCPTSGSESQFVIRMQNSVGESYNGWKLRITPFAEMPYIIQEAPLDGVAGSPYTFSMAATGDAPIIWTMVGQLPVGLNWNASNQTVTGIPVAAGSSSVTFSAINAGGKFARVMTFKIHEHKSGRVYPEALSWIGSFKLPADDRLNYAGGGSGGSGLTVTDRGTAFIGTSREGGPFNSDPNALYVAEVSIPPLIKSSDPQMLNRSVLIQSFSDSAEGRYSEILTGGLLLATKSLLWKSGRLYIGASAFYEGNGNIPNFYSRSESLDSKNSIIGMSRLHGSYGPRFYMGYMSEVPQRVQSEYGIGSVMSGGTLGSLVSHGSMGPSMITFSPETVAQPSSSTDKILGKELLGYPYTSKTDASRELPGQYGSSITQDNPYWRWGVTSLQGGVWLNSNSKRVVLFVGTMGLGSVWYGMISKGGAYMESDRSLSRKAGQAPDPSSNNKGTHAYPYVNYVWAYDESEILRVHRGEIKPYQAKPYHVWPIPMPIDSGDGAASIHGVAHDLKNRLIFISLKRAEKIGAYGATPIVHAFQYPD